jgi:exodeoxyribonuclease V alpha subunit
MSALQRRDPPPWLPPLGAALAEALPRLYGVPPDPRLTELIQALLWALEQGDLAIDLQGPAPQGISSEGWPEAHRAALEASTLALPPHGPLALDGNQLRWRRWQQLRQAVLEELMRRAEHQTPLQEGLAAADRLDAQQLLAIRTALERNLMVLAGGPGTGKTSTVAHLLEAVAQQKEEARIHLAAPTGKAAARLRAATGSRWPCTTLHQLLESRGEGEFRRNRQRPLKLDLLVVDEVSMVDLALMEALLRALPQDARLVLVGDPAQLAPVAPGAPLQDLLQGGLPPALQGAVVTLQTPYRNAGAIARVATALRHTIEDPHGPPTDPITVLRPELNALAPADNLHWQEAEAGPLPAVVLRRLQAHLKRLKQAASACTPGTKEGWPALLRLRDELLVLTPRHRGAWGVEAVHRQLLGEASIAALPTWPTGTPVICARNLHDLGLSNGDLGVWMAGQDPWLVFGQDRPIWLHPSQLTGALEPAAALTVHKAQGSESNVVMVLLPEPHSADSRLLYTALTRARQEAWLFTPKSAAQPC